VEKWRRYALRVAHSEFEEFEKLGKALRVQRYEV